MKTAQVTFYRMVLLPLQYAKETNHMPATVYFRIEYDGKVVEDYADIRQEVGTLFEAADLDISVSDVTKDTLQQEDFVEAVKQYHRDSWRRGGDGLRTLGGPADFSEDKIFNVIWKTEIPLKPEAVS